MEMIKEKKEKKIFIKKKNRSLINISVNSLENVLFFHHKRKWKVFHSSIATKEDIKHLQEKIFVKSTGLYNLYPETWGAGQVDLLSVDI